MMNTNNSSEVVVSDTRMSSSPWSYLWTVSIDLPLCSEGAFLHFGTVITCPCECWNHYHYFSNGFDLLCPDDIHCIGLCCNHPTFATSYPQFFPNTLAFPFSTITPETYRAWRLAANCDETFWLNITSLLHPSLSNPSGTSCWWYPFKDHPTSHGTSDDTTGLHRRHQHGPTRRTALGGEPSVTIIPLQPRHDLWPQKDHVFGES